MNNLLWVEKYRPETLSDIVSQDNNVQFIKNFLINKQLPHLLLFGSSGSGKTSAILACAKQLNNEYYHSLTLELNASEHRGIDVVRDKIKEFACTKTMYNEGIKIIILDEADSMTVIAQSALRRIIEKFSNNVKFCIICNYINKIIPALQSRCIRLRFSPLIHKDINFILNNICIKENIIINDSVMNGIINYSNGDMRKAINLLQNIHKQKNILSIEHLYSYIGFPTPNTIDSIINTLLYQNDILISYQTISSIIHDNGLLLSDIITYIHKKFSIFISNNSFHCTQNSIIFIFKHLANIEFNLSLDFIFEIQLCALISIFRLIQENISKNNLI